MSLTEESTHLLDLIKQCAADEDALAQIKAALQAAHTRGWLEGYNERATEKQAKAPAVKTYSCSCAPDYEHTVHSITSALHDSRYDDDRAAISLLQPGQTYTDRDGDVWERKS